MTTLRRVPVAWQTGAGGAGVGVFYSLGTDDATASLGTFFTAIKGLFPTAVSWSIPAAGDTFEHTTGALIGSWTGGTAATVVGTSGGAYAAGTGPYVRWLTNTVRAGRKFYGRTYLVPFQATSFDTDGTIQVTALGTIQTAATALVTAGKCVVWGRPLPGDPASGLFAGFFGAVVPDKVTSLRSRRS